MLTKARIIILLIALAVMGGAYYMLAGSGSEQTHNKNDADQHAHGEEKADHTEGGEHAHGDKDEHSHSKEEKSEEGGDEHGHDHGSGEAEEEGHGDETTISDNAAKNLGIEVLEANSGSVRETVSVTGRITLNQNTTAQVKARFPGVIRSVLKEPGQSAKANETLATVESNDSLQVYPVKSPVAGMIISRNANVGEVAADAPLFTVANLSNVWAELFIFSKDGGNLQQGQKIRIQSIDDGYSSESTISLVLPTTEASSQTMIARAVIDNPENRWRSGMNIRADIVLSEKQVPLVVKAEAIQRMEGNNVVFVQEEGKNYRAQPVEIGTSDGIWTEIRSGLSSGQRYVGKNSFVVKADIGKSAAEHEH